MQAYKLEWQLQLQDAWSHPFKALDAGAVAVLVQIGFSNEILNVQRLLQDCYLQLPWLRVLSLCNRFWLRAVCGDEIPSMEAQLLASMKANMEVADMLNKITERVDQQFIHIEQQFIGVNQQLTEVKQQLTEVKQLCPDLNQQFTELKQFIADWLDQARLGAAPTATPAVASSSFIPLPAGAAAASSELSAASASSGLQQQRQHYVCCYCRTLGTALLPLKRCCNF